MFNNKSLQLASFGHLDFYYFQSFLQNFENASLVNLNGDLLYSKDTSFEPTTTSRLVVYQIVKRYLQLNPGDIFITNDPENGGFNFQKVFFISCLTPNLFLIWCHNFGEVDFKIPLSPLLESHQKNKMLWSALIDAQPERVKFNDFFEMQIAIYSSCFRATPFLTFLSEPDFQNIWFTTCKAEYDRQFDLKASGHSEMSLKFFEKLIKTQLIIEEKQNQKSILLDFSNTQLATHESVASHIVESVLIQEIVYFYNLGLFLSQPILNQIKLILPPKSIISKAHPTGLYNFEFQALFKQSIHHLFNVLNNSKKSDPKFNLKNEAILYFSEFKKIGFYLDKSIMIQDLSEHFIITKQRQFENTYYGEYKLIDNKATAILRMLNQPTSNRHFHLNGQKLESGEHQLKKDDVIEFEWQI